MRLADYDQKPGKKVWLEQRELDRLIDTTDSPEERVAFLLGGKCGLRRQEVADVTPADFVATHGHHRVRVWEGKRDKYREVPVSQELYYTANTLASDLDADESVVGVHASTLYDWVKRAAKQRQVESNDRGWQYLDFHDLRRTWGTYLVGRGVNPSLIMQWGGWDDWETFRTNYLGEMSPEVDRREQQKVPWLADGEVDLADPDVHTLPMGTKPARADGGQQG
ncbi:MAG: tyrosine-type recombinase/integrase [Halobacteriaceae archaeon]